MTTKMFHGRRLSARILAVAAVSACAGLLAGCSASAPQSSAASGPTGALQILIGSNDGSNAGFKAIDAAFEKKYPKVKIVLDSVPDQSYASAESSRLTAGNVDIVTTSIAPVPSYAKSAASSDTQLAQSGGFVNLTKESFMKRIIPSLLTTYGIKGQQYAVPLGTGYVSGAFYNKALFAKYHLTVPTTWSKFVSDANVFESHGISMLGIGGKDSWPAGLPMLSAVQGYYPSTADKIALAKALWTQSTKFTDTKPLAVLSRVEQIYKYAEPNFAGVPYASIASGFAAGKYAMAPDVSVNETTIAAAVGSKFQFGYVPLPTSDIAANNDSLNGAVTFELSIPKSSPNQAAALAYLDFFTEPAQYKVFVKDFGTAPAETGIAAGAFLDSISQYTKTYESGWLDPNVFVPNPKAGEAASSGFNYTALTPMGSDTAQQAAAAAQQAWAAGF
ncbi:MAG TPA: extracellular solute-binding protein [Galbitalea sp.]|jgi:raffinose/stachyose/melibiose transport system substrate-binding protein|nr:extracellular solute-binding protein [Galbitalea sp.]